MTKMTKMTTLYFPHVLCVFFKINVIFFLIYSKPAMAASYLCSVKTMRKFARKLKKFFSCVRQQKTYY